MASAQTTPQHVAGGGRQTPVAMTAPGEDKSVTELIEGLAEAAVDEPALASNLSALVATVTGTAPILLVAENGRWRTPADGSAVIDSDELPPPNGVTELRHVDPKPSPPGLLATWSQASFGMLIPGRVDAHLPFIELLVSAVDSIITRRELADQLADMAQEQAGIARLLAIRDIDQLLLSTVNTANQLIDGDMAGVMLGDEHNLSMRCCVGNRSRQTEQLRFSPGQGVAGLVMQRGEPCRVDDYLESRTITHDFDSLARIEATKSALAAPLIADGTTIGVLEVWRRRPSTFSDSDVRRLVTLANLVGIAIDNARLHALRAENLDHLAETTGTLSRQVTALERARSTQTTLSRLLLEGEGTEAVCRAIAAELAAGVVLLSAELQVIARWPLTLKPDEIVLRVQSLAGVDRRGVEQKNLKLSPDQWLAAQAVRGGSDHLGWFCAVLSERPGIGEDLVIGEATSVAALCLVMERMAQVARFEHRQSLVWDLIEGTISQRRAAVDQARWLRVDLNRTRRLVRGEIVSKRATAGQALEDSEFEQARQRVLSKVRAAAMNLGVGELVAVRGNDLAIIVPDRDLVDIRDLVAELDGAATSVLTGHDVAWGVSAPCSNLLDLDRSNDEAISAVRAAIRLGLDGTAMYEDLGVVRLIVSNDDGDLEHFLHDVIGPLLRHDAERDSELVDTLRAYFAADYSHAEAAERLHIHYKTFSYRLSKIASLTGLDLRGHEGRMQADLALKLHDVTTRSRVTDI